MDSVTFYEELKDKGFIVIYTYKAKIPLKAFYTYADFKTFENQLPKLVRILF